MGSGVITYSETRFFKWVADETSVTLRSSGGSYGGGSEVLVVSYGLDSYNQAVDEEVAQPVRAHGGGDSAPKVVILNPTDSQGNQIADSNGVYPTLRACGGAAGYQSGYMFDRGRLNEEYAEESLRPHDEGERRSDPE